MDVERHVDALLAVFQRIGASVVPANVCPSNYEGGISAATPGPSPLPRMSLWARIVTWADRDAMWAQAGIDALRVAIGRNRDIIESLEKDVQLRKRELERLKAFKAERERQKRERERFALAARLPLRPVLPFSEPVRLPRPGDGHGRGLRLIAGPHDHVGNGTLDLIPESSSVIVEPITVVDIPPIGNTQNDTTRSDIAVVGPIVIVDIPPADDCQHDVALSNSAVVVVDVSPAHPTEDANAIVEVSHERYNRLMVENLSLHTELRRVNKRLDSVRKEVVRKGEELQAASERAESERCERERLTALLQSLPSPEQLETLRREQQRLVAHNAALLEQVAAMQAEREQIAAGQQILHIQEQARRREQERLPIMELAEQLGALMLDDEGAEMPPIHQHDITQQAKLQGAGAQSLEQQQLVEDPIDLDSIDVSLLADVERMEEWLAEAQLADTLHINERRERDMAEAQRLERERKAAEDREALQYAELQRQEQLRLAEEQAELQRPRDEAQSERSVTQPNFAQAKFEFRSQYFEPREERLKRQQQLSGGGEPIFDWANLGILRLTVSRDAVDAVPPGPAGVPATTAPSASTTHAGEASDGEYSDIYAATEMDTSESNKPEVGELVSEEGELNEDGAVEDLCQRNEQCSHRGTEGESAGDLTDYYDDSSRDNIQLGNQPRRFPETVRGNDGIGGDALVTNAHRPDNDEAPLFDEVAMARDGIGPYAGDDEDASSEDGGQSEEEGEVSNGDVESEDDENAPLFDLEAMARDGVVPPLNALNHPTEAEDDEVASFSSLESTSDESE